VALALLLTIALGIGSNASVFGFIHGSLTPNVPLPGIETVVSLFARDGQGAFIPVSYESYLSIKTHADVFESVGAARESQGNVVLADRSLVMSVAAVTSELADTLHLSLHQGVVISHRAWQAELGAASDVRGERIRIDGVEARVAGVGPEPLEGLYLGRAVDIWMPLREESLQTIDRGGLSFWALARLRPGVSIDRARAAVNATRSRADALVVLPYTGMTPEMTGGMSRIGGLLSAAAGAVFLIACANVASFLLARASTRSHETSVRVALGAGRGRLTRQLLADSVLVSVTGGAVAVLLAVWTAQIVPALFFEQDAEHLAFAPNLYAIVAASAVCAGITIACGLLPLVQIRHDHPAVVFQPESAGPSKATRRLRDGLVMAQMTCCCLLVISTGLLFQAFRDALQTSAGHRLGQPILVTVQARLDSPSPHEATDRGLKYFDVVEREARAAADAAASAWVGTLPGSAPAWQSMRIEPRQLPVRDVVMDVAAFTPQSLAVIRVPPVAGRLFGGEDTAQACTVVIVNEEADGELFDGDAVGRSIADPSGRRVEIVGVVATRKPRRTKEPGRPTVYYYADQTRTPLDHLGPALFRVPARPAPASAVFDVNVVSASYFDAMGFPPIAGRVFQDDPAPRSCRVGVINEEAANRYFGGNALGAAVIDSAGRRTEIIGVVHAARLRSTQRREPPAIYLPMRQDFRPRMTLVLGTRDANRDMLASIERRLGAVAGGGAPVVVTTLDAHLSRTALAPDRIATVLVGASAATALMLGVLGLYGAMTDAAHQRRREIAVRLALGAQGWRVIGRLFAEGVRLAGVGSVAGMLGSVVVARWLARLTPMEGSPAVWVWLAAPLVSVAAVAIASVFPARRALRLNPLAILRDTR
jgi:predicted permease